jgi:predicted transcriptional regulator
MELIGPLQLRIMNFIWQKGDCTVHDVHDALNGTPDAPQLAYTTVLTVMRNLVRRKILSQNPAGRSHVFSPLIGEHEYKEAMLQQICDNFFNGAHEQMVALIQQPAVA